MKWDLSKLVAMGLKPEQINLLLDQTHQRKVTQSNVALTPAEIELHRARFAAKHYFGPAEQPLKPRMASKIEGKYKLNKNLTDKQVEELIKAERKFGRSVLRLSPTEVRELLKTGAMEEVEVEE
jgi:hypothetical protein